MTEAEFSHDGHQVLKPDQKTENISNELQKFIHSKNTISYYGCFNVAALMWIKYAPVQTRKGIYHLQAPFSTDLSFLLANIKMRTVVS